LCPFEAIRIRSVSDPTFPRGVFGGITSMVKTDGFSGLYAGLFPMVFKQLPYVMTQFVVQGRASEMIYNSMNITPQNSSNATNLSISIMAGLIAGVFAAIASHPADTLLSKINKKGAGGDGSTMLRLLNISKEMGFYKLCVTGLLPRCVMIAGITAGQFGVFDAIMNLFGAKKFYFSDPSK
jgi:solute carrier family 25 (mitochondrial phosphate transporter), member 3